MANEYELTPERKEEIDSLAHHDCCRIWRYAATGNWMIMGDCGDYFKKRLFDHFGGFTSQISKALS